jgi:hypothetical protein
VLAHTCRPTAASTSTTSPSALILRESTLEQPSCMTHHRVFECWHTPAGPPPPPRPPPAPAHCPCEVAPLPPLHHSHSLRLRPCAAAPATTAASRWLAGQATSRIYRLGSHPHHGPTANTRELSKRPGGNAESFRGSFAENGHHRHPEPWCASAGWDTKYDGCMRGGGCSCAGWGGKVRRLCTT